MTRSYDKVGAFGTLVLALALVLCLTYPFLFMRPALAQATVTIVSADGKETVISGPEDDAEESEVPPVSSLSLNVEGSEDGEEAADNPTENPTGDASAREAFIDGILALAKETYDETGGRARRAQYSGDIYVCKNFTVYLFRENRDRFRMAEFPEKPLVIPDNQKRDDCKPYVYGVEWKDIPASEGNPFYAAATFRYDDKLSKEENREKAREFLKQAKRGDYFQMAAKYYYGTGAHSMLFVEDYDEAKDSVHWTDSNMKGETRGGERYGYVQYDAVKEIDWFVDAFCRKSYGATIYRLRDDIVFAKDE